MHPDVYADIVHDGKYGADDFSNWLDKVPVGWNVPVMGKLSETGKGIATKQFGDPAPCTYEPVVVFCPACEKEKTVTPATHTWPRCDDCDEPMRRGQDMPEKTPTV